MVKMALKDLNPGTAEHSMIVKEFICFGQYPQSVAPIEYEPFMEYIDSVKQYHCTLDDCYYIEDTAKPYQALFSPRSYYFSSGKPVETGKAYYFKLEPIEWIVLHTNQNVSILLSKKIIDSKLYLEPEFVGKARVDGYPNNYYPGVDSAFPNTWEYSTLRAWLNGIHTYHNYGNFFDFAFTKEEQKRIKTVCLKNDPKSSGIKRPNAYSWVHQKETHDKVYCLSVAEATSYIFSNDPRKKDSDIDKQYTGRAAEVTDYAIAKGVCPYYIADRAIGWWWLRSPGDPDEHEVAIYNQSKAPICQKRACDVTEDGHICQRASIVCGSDEDTCDGSANGVRPAINVEFN